MIPYETVYAAPFSPSFLTASLLSLSFSDSHTHCVCFRAKTHMHSHTRPIFAKFTIAFLSLPVTPSFSLYFSTSQPNNARTHRQRRSFVPLRYITHFKRLLSLFSSISAHPNGYVQGRTRASAGALVHIHLLRKPILHTRCIAYTQHHRRVTGLPLPSRPAASHALAVDCSKACGENAYIVIITTRSVCAKLHILLSLTLSLSLLLLLLLLLCVEALLPPSSRLLSLLQENRPRQLQRLSPPLSSSIKTLLLSLFVSLQPPSRTHSPYSPSPAVRACVRMILDGWKAGRRSSSSSTTRDRAQRGKEGKTEKGAAGLHVC